MGTLNVCIPVIPSRQMLSEVIQRLCEHATPISRKCEALHCRHGRHLRFTENTESSSSCS